MNKTALLLALAACAGSLHADVKLPGIISRDMVLTKTAQTPVWGWADPGETVVVTLDGQTTRTTAGADGRWRTALDLSKSGVGPFDLVVQGKNRITIPNVVVGEVWLASGQSNMEFALRSTEGATEEAANSENPLFRQFVVKRKTSLVPMENCEGTWRAAGPLTSPGFTAVGYYFGKRIQHELGVPVGLINSSWGGTPSEAWTSIEALDTVPELKATREESWVEINTHPDRIKAWRDAFGAWLKQSQREDRAAADPALFAAPDASTEGWTAIQVPGPSAVPTAPEPGAVWVRKEVTVPESQQNKPLWLDLGIMEGFDSVYWNGELATRMTYREHPGAGAYHRSGDYIIPAEKIRAGANTIAIRIYSPVAPPKLFSYLKIGNLNVSNEWLSKVEFTLPPLTPAQLAAAPKQPAALSDPAKVAAHLYNGMINPLIPYAISGVVWYQGETNAPRAYQYRTAFPLMITGWRTAWGQGDFPFYFCQLANWRPKKPQPAESDWAELREAQSMALSLPNTGQAALIDLGESRDIHPRNKKDVGERLARIALAKTYGRDIEYSGPEYTGMKIEGARIRITFNHVGGGLVAKELPAEYPEITLQNKYAPLVRNSPASQLEGFALCGADQKWVWADAKIDGETVVVWSDKIPAPVAVRYAWADNPTCNLYNAAGLPAFPFRTDDFPAITRDVRY
jgi:sialate O-acetylesterase